MRRASVERSRTNSHRSWMRANSLRGKRQKRPTKHSSDPTDTLSYLFSEFLSSLILAWVISPREKSKTSSLKSCHASSVKWLPKRSHPMTSTFKMTMQFSHKVSLLRAAPTRSGTNDCHLAGHSCFKIWKRRPFRTKKREDKTVPRPGPK